MDKGILAAAEASTVSDKFIESYFNNMREAFNIKLDNVERWKKF